MDSLDDDCLTLVLTHVRTIDLDHFRGVNTRWLRCVAATSPLQVETTGAREPGGTVMFVVCCPNTISIKILPLDTYFRASLEEFPGAISYKELYFENRALVYDRSIAETQFGRRPCRNFEYILARRGISVGHIRDLIKKIC